jgi:hypothetical protein
MATRQVHKLTVLVVDHDDLGGVDVRDVIEDTRYPNSCIYPQVMSVETRDVEWSDDHPLNKTATQAAAFDELFKG